MKNKKLKVAVTGSIGSGKSSFCSFMEEKGFPVIKADDISKEILSNDEKIKKKIIKAFGEDSYKNGKPDKKYLAEKIFSDPKKVFKINSILHPEVIKRTKELIDELHKNNNLIFVEAALIYEADMEEMFDYVVLITADENIRLQRAVSANKMTEEEFLNRSENQITDEEKMRRADFIFINNSSPDDLKTKANLLLTILGRNK